MILKTIPLRFGTDINWTLHHRWILALILHKSEFAPIIVDGVDIAPSKWTI